MPITMPRRTTTADEDCRQHDRILMRNNSIEVVPINQTAASVLCPSPRAAAVDDFNHNYNINGSGNSSGNHHIRFHSFNQSPLQQQQQGSGRSAAAAAFTGHCVSPSTVVPPLPLSNSKRIVMDSHTPSPPSTAENNPSRFSRRAWMQQQQQRHRGSNNSNHSSSNMSIASAATAPPSPGCGGTGNRSHVVSRPETAPASLSSSLRSNLVLWQEFYAVVLWAVVCVLWCICLTQWVLLAQQAAAPTGHPLDNRSSVKHPPTLHVDNTTSRNGVTGFFVTIVGIVAYTTMRALLPHKVQTLQAPGFAHCMIWILLWIRQCIMLMPWESWPALHLYLVAPWTASHGHNNNNNKHTIATSNKEAIILAFRQHSLSGCCPNASYRIAERIMGRIRSTRQLLRLVAIHVLGLILVWVCFMPFGTRNMGTITTTTTTSSSATMLLLGPTTNDAVDDHVLVNRSTHFDLFQSSSFSQHGQNPWWMDALAEVIAVTLFTVGLMVLPTLLAINAIHPGWTLLVLYPVYNMSINAAGDGSTLNPAIGLAQIVMHLLFVRTSTISTSSIITSMICRHVLPQILGGVVAGTIMIKYFPDDHSFQCSDMLLNQPLFESAASPQ